MVCFMCLLLPSRTETNETKIHDDEVRTIRSKQFDYNAHYHLFKNRAPKNIVKTKYKEQYFCGNAHRK